jgi:hypothetical protein
MICDFFFSSIGKQPLRFLIRQARIPLQIRNDNKGQGQDCEITIVLRFFFFFFQNFEWERDSRVKSHNLHPRFII